MNDISYQELLEQHQVLQREVANLHAQLETTIHHANAVEAALYQRNAELESARLEAEQANETKGKFLSTVTHELRTPLTSMMGFAKLIERDMREYLAPHISPENALVQEVLMRILGDVKIIREEGKRLMNLINDVLNISRIEADAMIWKMEPILLQKIVEEAVQTTLGLFDEGRKLQLHIEDDVPEIQGDYSKLARVVVNLISNAVKFSDSDIICRVKSYRDDLGQWACVEVEDFGIGIAPENHAIIFEKFRQVEATSSYIHNNSTGTGLGLAICREIIEHHCGKLELRSALGDGSTFSFCLPVYTEKDTPTSCT